jgi:hypothetical protein
VLVGLILLVIDTNQLMVQLIARFQASLWPEAGK